MVSMSFSSVDDRLSALLEPGCPPPSERLAVLREAKERGLAAGMFLMPVIPRVSDSAAQLEESVAAAVDAGLDYIIFGGMTMKPGRQQEHLLAMLREHFPPAVIDYPKIYRGDRWGGPNTDYYEGLSAEFHRIIMAAGIPARIPVRLWRDLVDPDDAALVTLEHIDYYLKASGRRSQYGYSAWQLFKSGAGPTELRQRPGGIGGIFKSEAVGSAVEAVVEEVLDTGRSVLLEELASYSVQ